MANVSSSNGLEKRPKLRFPGFDEPWIVRKLSDILSQRIEKQVPSKDAPLMAFTAEGGVEPKGERYDRSYLVKSEDKLYKRTEYNDFIYSSNNLDVGSIGLNKYGTAVISDVYEIFSVKSDCLPTFVSELIQRPQNLAKILKYRQGCLYGQYRIYAEDFLSVSVFVPAKQEQNEIAQFLDSIDKRIAHQHSLIEALKKYKRGAVRCLLSAKSCPLRNARWTTAKMGELGSFVKGAPLSKADISEDGTPFILYGELYTTYNEVVTSVKRRTQAQVDETFLSRVGDVVIPTSGETPEEISTASCIMLPDVILAGDLNIFRGDKVDGRIMSYLLNHVVNGKIARIAQGKSVVHIQASELCKLTLTYPDKNTQNTIIGFLSLLDDKIMNEENSLAFLSALKEGLLQQLFI